MEKERTWSLEATKETSNWEWSPLLGTKSQPEESNTGYPYLNFLYNTPEEQGDTIDTEDMSIKAVLLLNRPEELTLMRIYNIFSLYANVLKIDILS